MYLFFSSIMQKFCYRWVVYLSVILCISACVEGGGTGYFSHLVILSIHPLRPIVFYNQKSSDSKICRKGTPDRKDSIPIWDLQKLQQGDIEELDEASTSNSEDRKDRVLEEVPSGCYIQVAPLISNQSNYHLIINRIDFEISSTDSKDIEPKVHSVAGGWCETNTDLYYLPPKDFIAQDALDRRFHKGNIWFYIPIDGCEDNSDDSFGRAKVIPAPSIRWQVIGTFKDQNGSDVGYLKKTGGSFQTQPASF